LASPRISFRLDKATRARLQKVVEATGASESDLLREALHAYLDEQPGAESCLDLARRHRLLGRAKKLPADLSTNRKHFEGFGR
jgi:predicted DNA-binding protein